jgi:mono/diheme cytochrome c family protein
MLLYAVANYLHVVGSMAYFFTLGIEWTSVARLRHAETAEQARAWFSLLAVGRLIGRATLTAVVLPALYMAWTVWGWPAWIIVSLVALGLMAALAAHNGIRLANIERDLGQAIGPLPVLIAQRLTNPLFMASLYSRVVIILGIIFLMTAKPDLGFGLLPAEPGVPTAGGDAVAGQRLFAAQCNSCHPSANTGIGPVLYGPQFVQRYPEDERLIAVVRQGRGGMPAYSPGQLSDQNLADIIAYLHGLSSGTIAPEPTPTALTRRGG